MSYLNSPLHHFPLSPSFPIPGIVSTGIIFPFTYMCTQYLHHIHLHTLFPSLLTTLNGIQPPCNTCSALLFSCFV
jgi:hypothetical protein